MRESCEEAGSGKGLLMSANSANILLNFRPLVVSGFSTDFTGGGRIKAMVGRACPARSKLDGVRSAGWCVVLASAAERPNMPGLERNFGHSFRISLSTKGDVHDQNNCACWTYLHSPLIERFCPRWRRQRCCWRRELRGRGGQLRCWNGDCDRHRHLRPLRSIRHGNAGHHDRRKHQQELGPNQPERSTPHCKRDDTGGGAGRTQLRGWSCGERYADRQPRVGDERGRSEVVGCCSSNVRGRSLGTY